MKIIQFFITGLVIGLTMFHCGYAQSIHNELSQIDTYFQNRHQPEQLKQSIELLERLSQKETLSEDDKYNIYWRLARHYAFLNDDIVPDFNDISRDDKLKLFLKGEDYGKLAIKINPNNTQGYYWKGVLIGRTAEFRGILNSLFAVGPIEKSMKKVIELDPSHAGAHFVLARLYRKAPPFISAGNMTLSKKFIDKAVSLHPTRTLYQLEKGKIYKKLKKWDKAKEAFNRVISIPDHHSDFQPDVDAHKKEAKALLKLILE